MRDHGVLLASYRPTAVQAAVHGTWRGALVAGGVAVLGLVAAAAGVVQVPATAWVVGVLGPVVVAAVDGAVRGRDRGVDADDQGLRPVPPEPVPLVRWDRVADVHAERHRRRTVVAVSVADGSVVRLPAPYDGVLLGRDAHFERKLFTLRHLWETRRHWQAESP